MPPEAVGRAVDRLAAVPFAGAGGDVPGITGAGDTEPSPSAR